MKGTPSEAIVMMVWDLRTAVDKRHVGIMFIDDAEKPRSGI